MVFILLVKPIQDIVALVSKNIYSLPLMQDNTGKPLIGGDLNYKTTSRSVEHLLART